MFTNSKLAKSIRLAMAFGAASTALASNAALAQEATDDEVVEKIEVTGSRIKRTDMESASPIAVFTKAEIENTGVSTVAEFLRTNAATGGFNESATLSQAAGASSVGLKGFASNYTLILLNGRRLPKNSAGGIFTDINQIPLAAVERIDILPDGASAIYGSDAIAGVINIVTKRDYEGVALSVKSGMALKEGDGEENQVQFTAGVSSDKTNMLFTFDYFSRDPIMAKDRDLGGAAYIKGVEGAEGRSTWGIPGSTYVSSPSTPKAGWAPWSDCPADQVHPNGRCRYDFAPLYQLQPKSERQSMLTLITHEVTDELTVDAQFRYSRAYTLTSNAPAPGAVDISDSPFLRDFLITDRYADDPALGAKIADEIADGNGFAYVGRRYLDFPNREKDNTNETFEGVVGFGYDISDEWSIDADFGFSRLTNRQIGKRGQLLKAEVEKAFANGSLNPFVINDCSSEKLKETCESLNSSIHRTGEYETSFMSIVGAGTLDLGLPGGEIGIATGLDYREEEYLDRSDTASINGDVIGGAGSNGGGDFNNTAVFLEVELPILDQLTVNLAVRQDSAEWGENSDASEATYSAKLAYRPIDELLIRASYGTGFKAPALDELYLASSFGVSPGTIDTKLCNKAVAEGGDSKTHPDCKGIELNSKSGGNIDLEPETSVSANFGVVYEFTDGISLSVDYWSLKIENIIGQLGIQEILDAEAKGELTDLVIRNSAGRLDDTAREGFVQTNLQNLTESSASGIIYNLQTSSDLDFGTLTSNVKVEQYLSFESQQSAVQPLCDSIEDDASRPWTLNGNLTLETDKYSTSLTLRYLPGYDSWNRRDTANKSCQLIGEFDVDLANKDYGRPQDHDSYFEIGAKASYFINDSHTITVGIRNLTDEQPPFHLPYDWPFYSQSTYNNIGRFAYLQWDAQF